MNEISNITNINKIRRGNVHGELLKNFEIFKTQNFNGKILKQKFLHSKI